MNMNNACPCDSGEKYRSCCQPFISGKAMTETPEQLMRSRYSAYTQANVDYSFETMLGEALIRADRQAVQRWAEQSEWLRLEVLDAPVVDENAVEGEVEFKAYLKENRQVKVIHERSTFFKDKGRWFYIDGQHF